MRVHCGLLSQRERIEVREKSQSVWARVRRRKDFVVALPHPNSARSLASLLSLALPATGVHAPMCSRSAFASSISCHSAVVAVRNVTSASILCSNLRCDQLGGQVKLKREKC